MAKEFNYNDLPRARIKRQFTLSNAEITALTPNSRVLNDPNLIYVITETQGTGGALDVVIDGKKFTRTIATGRVEYFNPIAGEIITVPAGVTEISGYTLVGGMNLKAPGP